MDSQTKKLITKFIFIALSVLSVGAVIAFFCNLSEDVPVSSTRETRKLFKSSLASSAPDIQPSQGLSQHASTKSAGAATKFPALSSGAKSTFVRLLVAILVAIAIVGVYMVYRIKNPLSGLDPSQPKVLVQNTSKASISAKGIVGIVVSCVAVVALLVGALLLVRHKKNQQRAKGMSSLGNQGNPSSMAIVSSGSNMSLTTPGNSSNMNSLSSALIDKKERGEEESIVQSETPNVSKITDTDVKPSNSDSKPYFKYYKKNQAREFLSWKGVIKSGERLVTLFENRNGERLLIVKYFFEYPPSMTIDWISLRHEVSKNIERRSPGTRADDNSWSFQVDLDKKCTTFKPQLIIRFTNIGMIEINDEFNVLSDGEKIVNDPPSFIKPISKSSIGTKKQIDELNVSPPDNSFVKKYQSHELRGREPGFVLLNGLERLVTRFEDNQGKLLVIVKYLFGLKNVNDDITEALMILSEPKKRVQGVYDVIDDTWTFKFERDKDCASITVDLDFTKSPRDRNFSVVDQFRVREEEKRELKGVPSVAANREAAGPTYVSASTKELPAATQPQSDPPQPKPLPLPPQFSPQPSPVSNPQHQPKPSPRPSPPPPSQQPQSAPPSQPSLKPHPQPQLNPPPQSQPKPVHQCTKKVLKVTSENMSTVTGAPVKVDLEIFVPNDGTRPLMMNATVEVSNPGNFKIDNVSMSVSGNHIFSGGAFVCPSFAGKRNLLRHNVWKFSNVTVPDVENLTMDLVVTFRGRSEPEKIPARILNFRKKL